MGQFEHHMYVTYKRIINSEWEKEEQCGERVKESDLKKKKKTETYTKNRRYSESI